MSTKCFEYIIKRISSTIFRGLKKMPCKQIESK